MSTSIIEESSFGANPGTKDLARHLYTRMFCGKAIIIADNPTAVLGPLRKQWLKLARKARREAASTLSATRLYEFNIIIPRMYTLKFTQKNSAEDIYITTIDKLPKQIHGYATIYITCNVDLSLVSPTLGNSLLVWCKLA